MATRDSYAQDPNAGDVLTAVNFRKLPGGWIGYAEGSTDQTGITTNADVTGCTVTLTPDSSRRLKITGQVFCEASGAAARASLAVFADGAQVGAAGQLRLETTGTAGRSTAHVTAVITPTSASHTYKLNMTAATGTLNLPSATQLAWILVEDIGPAS